jgi:putative acetyltransferase
MLIRPEMDKDHDAVYAVNAAAFPTPAEAKLVNALREQAAPLVSLVAEDESGVVGHILFSPVTLSSRPDLPIMGLAPMAVSPAQQNRGVGSALVRSGLEACRELGALAVVVLGHADYYPRFGFVPSSRFGIDSEYDVPDEVFMALELQPGALAESAGRIRFHACFADL